MSNRNKNPEPEIKEEPAPKTGELSISVPLFFLSDFDLTGGDRDMKDSTETVASCNGNCTCGGKKV